MQVDGAIVDLTRIEYDVLEYLATHLSRVCTREEMVLAIWSSALTHDHHLVDVHVANLRGKLLLAHGGMDDNVPPYNTYLVVDALVKANKDFDLVIFPNARHGYGVARWIEDATDSAVVVEEGSLYPALYRLERRGLIDAEWGTSELGRRAKFYRLTPKGRRHLVTETDEWARFAAGVSKILLPT